MNSGNSKKDIFPNENIDEVVSSFDGFNVQNEDNRDPENDPTTNQSENTNLEENESNEENSNTEVEDDTETEDLETRKKLEESLTEEELENRHLTSLKLKDEGNLQFKSELFMESIQTYTKALEICPLKYDSNRSIFYCNRAAAKIKINKTKNAIKDCSNAIELNPSYLRAYLRRAKLYEDSKKLDECLDDYKKILEFDPGNKEALCASVRLPPLIHERNEKMKTEMLGKLKDLGNLVLRPFGLSTDNFQVQQDPTSGGYSINFQQNKPKS